MIAYTLDQLVAVNNRALDKVNLREGMSAIGASDDAVFAVIYSDSLRNGNLVRFFHEYGNFYGDDFCRHIDRFLIQAGLAHDAGPRYTLGQLAWISTILMFPGEMKQALAAIGVSGEVAESFARSCKESGNNVVKFWEIERQQFSAEVHRYFSIAMASYPENWPHNELVEPEKMSVRP